MEAAASQIYLVIKTYPRSAIGEFLKIFSWVSLRKIFTPIFLDPKTNFLELTSL